jgi:type IV pilus assembly protein PilP
MRVRNPGPGRLASVGLLVVGLGCTSDPRPAPAPVTSTSSSSVAAVTPGPVAPPPPQAVAPPSELDRDPFAPQIAPPTAPQAPVRPDEAARKAKKYSVDQLKLVGIVNADEPRAMLVDPRGKGWIVGRGDRVGRAELKVDHYTGWRVDRIRGEDVVLVREDATREGSAPETRVLALHAAKESPDIDD